MDAIPSINDLPTLSNLSILTLSDPYLAPNQPSSKTHRSSITSSTPDRDLVSPSILLADLLHYRELFSKLRFSYVEQVTKERFLRAITAEQPEFVDASENAVLEEKLKGDKMALKERKREVGEMVRELEEQGRQLARRYDAAQLQIAQLDSLPAEIENLEATVQTLRRTQGPRSDNPELTMPLDDTLSLLQQKDAELDSVQRQIASLRAVLPDKQAQIRALEEQVSRLNDKRVRAVEEAQEARRRREVGGVGDEMDEMGRWLRSVESGLKTMLDVEGSSQAVVA